MKKPVLTFFAGFVLGLSLLAQHQNIVIGNQNDPNEPSIIINPKNADVMLAGSNLDSYYISTDGGYSWTSARLESSAFGVWGDPCMLIDTVGSFYFFHLSNPPGPAWIDRIVCQKSYNQGATWNTGTGIGLNGEKAQDKEWGIVDPVNNRMYLTWTQFDNYGSALPNDSSIILFSSSLNQGATWTTPVRLNKLAGDCIDSDNTVEGAVPAIGPDGEIYVAWAGPAGLMFDKSMDGGNSWLDNDIYVADIPGGWDYNIPGIYRANGLPVTCCDLSQGDHRGTIYINWSDQRNGTDDTDVWLVTSTDGGATWSQPKRVNDDAPGKQQFFTWMTVDQSTGRLWFVFYDRRNYSDNSTDVYMAFSDDGGVSFANFKVSESPFIPTELVFFGDYTNVSAVNNVVRPIWTRLHNGNLSVLTAIVDPLIVGTGPMVPLAEESEVYPNPGQHDIYFGYKLNEAACIHLEMVDMQGRKCALLIDNVYQQAGKYRQKIDCNALGLKPGIYMLQLSNGKNTRLQKVVISAS